MLRNSLLFLPSLLARAWSEALANWCLLSPTFGWLVGAGEEEEAKGGREKREGEKKKKKRGTSREQGKKSSASQHTNGGGTFCLS